MPTIFVKETQYDDKKRRRREDEERLTRKYIKIPALARNQVRLIDLRLLSSYIH